MSLASRSSLTRENVVLLVPFVVTSPFIYAGRRFNSAFAFRNQGRSRRRR